MWRRGPIRSRTPPATSSRGGAVDGILRVFSRARFGTRAGAARFLFSLVPALIVVFIITLFVAMLVQARAAREEEILVVPEGGSMYQQNMSMVLDGHTGIEHAIPVAPLYRDALQLIEHAVHLRDVVLIVRLLDLAQATLLEAVGLPVGAVHGLVGVLRALLVTTRLRQRTLRDTQETALDFIGIGSQFKFGLVNADLFRAKL